MEWPAPRSWWIRVVLPAGEMGRLMALLDDVPRSHWGDFGLDATLLHFACTGCNVDAARALIAHGIHPDVLEQRALSTPAHFAASNSQARMLHTLHTAGADLTVVDALSRTPLDVALHNLPEAAGCVRVLVAHGVRLSSAGEEFCHLITPELRLFERGVLRCRAATVAMLRVKRVGASAMARWDRFLLAMVARHVWSTRAYSAWSMPVHHVDLL